MLIAATDGVLDNMFEEELQGCVSEHLEVLMSDDPAAAQEAISMLATSIAEKCHILGLSEDPMLDTPFKQEAFKEEGYEKIGGKLDDIAIVCGIVRKGARPAPRVVHNLESAGDADEMATRDPSPPAAPATFGSVLPTGVPQMAPPQTAPAGQASPQMAPPQMGPPQMRPPQMAAPGQGPPQMAPPQMAPPQMGAPQMAPPQMAPNQQNIDELMKKHENAFAEVKMGAPQMAQMAAPGQGPPQMAPPQMAPPQMGAPQMAQMAAPAQGPPQMAPPQMAPPQMAPPQMAPPQMAPPQSNAELGKVVQTGAVGRVQTSAVGKARRLRQSIKPAPQPTSDVSWWMRP